MFDGQECVEEGHGVGGGAEADPALGSGGPAAAEGAFGVGGIGQFPGGRSGLFGRHGVQVGGHELLVDVVPQFGVEVVGFGGDQVRNVFADLTVGQQSVGVGEVEPQRPGQGESAAAFVGSDFDGERDLVGDAPAESAVVDPGRLLRGDLGLGELHRFGGLHCRHGALDLFQHRDPVDPDRIGDRAAAGHQPTQRAENLGQVAEHRVTIGPQVGGVGDGCGHDSNARPHH